MGNSNLEIKRLQWQGVPISIFLRMILARYLMNPFLAFTEWTVWAFKSHRQYVFVREGHTN